MKEPTILNWRTSPPAGGWSLVYTPPEFPDRRIGVSGTTHTEVLEQIRQWRVNNKLAPNDEEVFSFCNIEWCRRDPRRCRAAIATTSAAAPATTPTLPAGGGRRKLQPTDYGRGCWLWLNTFGVNFDSGLWQAAIKQIQMLLSPFNPHNNGAGCITCHQHFAEFCYAHPPHLVNSADEAAVWAWMAHDGANVYSGKPHRPTFRVCSAIFGWVPLTPEEFIRVAGRLTRS